MVGVDALVMWRPLEARMLYPLLGVKCESYHDAKRKTDCLPTGELVLKQSVLFWSVFDHESSGDIPS